MSAKMSNDFIIEAVLRYGCGEPTRSISLAMQRAPQTITRALRRGGIKAIQGSQPRNVAERFWSHVEKHDGADACWEWTGYRMTSGYGSFQFGGFQTPPVLAHRVSFYLANGFWPTVARHKCDNPPCVRPDHILDGTHADNMRDKVERGRSNAPRGEQIAKSRLKEYQVLEIRKMLALGAVSQRAIAILFGVSKSTIGAIAVRQTWRHV